MIPDDAFKAKNDKLQDLKGLHYFQQILEYSLDMICSTDVVGRFVSMSPAVEKILGYSVEDLIGAAFLRFVHPDDVIKTSVVFEKLLTGNPVTNFLNRYRKKDGGYAHISWCSIWSNENQLVYGVARDVTEFVLNAEKNLLIDQKIAQSEYFLNEVGRIARFGGWEYDIAQSSAKWSKSIYDIYEFPYQYNPGLDDIWRFYKEPYRAQLKQAIIDAQEKGKSWDIEVELTTAKGKVIWVRSHGEAVYEHDEIVKLRGSFMDIDKYHKNEEALNRSLNLLTQQNRQLNGFTHILSHNLRNHANNISMLASFLDSGKHDHDNRELVNQLKKISGKLNNTLDDMSEAIKIRDSVIASNRIYLPDAVDQALSHLDMDLRYCGTEVITDIVVKDITFPKIYIQSILTNLISNSIKYKKPKERPIIIISTYFDTDRNSTVMRYQDNGIGIDLNKHGDSVFGLYSTFTDHPDAHGVGLFLVKTQVESQGGQILIESTLNVGTCFKIIFKPDIRT
jgi:PAS domain S-box-containing protein